MSVRNTVALAFPLLASIMLAGAPAWGAEQEKAQILSVMQAVAGAWDKGNVPPSDYFESSLTIVDDTPPYLFHGSDAMADWIKAYRNTQPAGAEDAKTSLHILQPKTVEISGPRAYAAIPADWTEQQGSKREVSHGVITVTLNKSDQGWRIAAWIWTPR